MKGVTVRRFSTFILVLLLANLLALTLLFETGVVRAVPECTLYVVPSHVMDITLTAGNTFWIDIDITAYEYLYAWQVWLNYTPAILTLSNLIFGAVLPNPNFNFDPVEGWVMMGETMTGSVEGIAGGPSTLASLQFTVNAYGDSELVFDRRTEPATVTYVQYCLGALPWEIEIATDDGYFSNKLLGDCDGDSGKDVDYDDLVILAGAYGSSKPSPAYDARADFYRDGDVDYDDLVILAGAYGTSLP